MDGYKLINQLRNRGKTNELYKSNIKNEQKRNINQLICSKSDPTKMGIEI